MSTPRIEEYLEAIFKLEKETRSAVGVTRIANSLGLSVPSASEMMKRLEQSGTISYNARREVSLTDQGRTEATSVIRRHRLAERLLTDVLGFDWDEVHDEACRLEHAISPAVEARLAAHLGEPETCPHGYSIPSPTGEIAERELISLDKLDVGTTAKVAVVPEEEPKVLQYLAKLKLRPGTRISVREIAPFGGPITLNIEDGVEAIGPELATRVMVEVEY